MRSPGLGGRRVRWCGAFGFLFACVWLGYGQVWRRAECFSPQVQLSTKQVSPPTRPATVELGGRVVHGYLSLTHLSVASLPRYV